MSTYSLSPARRAELNQKSNWRGSLEVAKDWALIISAFAISLAWPHPLTYFFSVFLLSCGMTGFSILQHEASHRSLFATPALNEWVGEYLAALPILQSMPCYRTYHMTHHRLAGTAEDPDLIMTERYPVSPSSLRRKLWRDLSGQSGIKSIIALMGMYAGYWKYQLTGQTERLMPAPVGFTGYARHFIKNNGHIAILFQVAIWGALYALGNGWLYGLWVIAFIIVLPTCQRIRQIADHAVVADPLSKNPLMHARTTSANWFEKMLFAPHYEHYHLEHHLMPTAACWQLPKLHAELKAAGVIPEQNQASSLLSVLRRATTH
ncbi:fatty acid desaturase family protein [Paraperlucidibaca sp.]|uniref:fatty acid desaturase family protein n=1 Tax=Paraperlucidibaca sp. TaxID=2708021 RepID=UPI0030F4A568